MPSPVLLATDGCTDPNGVGTRPAVDYYMNKQALTFSLLWAGTFKTSPASLSPSLSPLTGARSNIFRQAIVAAAATDDAFTALDPDECRCSLHEGVTVGSDLSPSCPATELPALTRHGSAPRAARTSRLCIPHNALKPRWLQGLATDELA